MPQTGIVCQLHNNIYTIRDLESNTEFLAHKKNSASKLTIGDRVEFIRNSQSCVIENLLPRKNLIKKPLLSNIDFIFLIISIADPAYSLYAIDSFLAYYNYYEIKPILIFNKTDLDTDNHQKKLSAYKNLGYDCHFFSANNLTENERKKLLSLITNKTVAFAGNSGVGKSTLINRIFGKDILTTGDISTKSKKGKQTTTQAGLYYHEKTNSFIADTPGYSMIDLPSLKNANLHLLFPEFGEFSENCKFDNCQHLIEPDCAVKQALEEKKIILSRYESYQKIHAELNKMKIKY